MDDIENLIIDMDGVLWRGNTPAPGLTDFFATLAQLGIGYVLATNNAMRTPMQYVEKLAGFGVSVSPEQILTSAEATADYLSERYGPERHGPERHGPDNGAETAVYVIGDLGIRQALETRHFRLLTPAQVKAGQTAPLVVVGFTRNFTYDDVAMGSLLVHKGASFIGTNPDVSFPTELGPLPGAGALQAIIATATGKQPDVIVGKPGPTIFREAVKRLGATPETTAMAGDRLETDIKGAKNAGLKTILLLSGISTREEAERADGDRPDYIFGDIQELAERLRNGE